MSRAACPECDTWVSFPSSAELGQRVLCEKCSSELVVIRTSPVELDWAFIEPFQKPEKLGRKNDMNGY